MVRTDTIKPAVDSRKLVKRKFRTYDIIQLVNEVERSDRDDVEHFAKQFPPTMQGLRRLFNFVLHNIRYQEDPDGAQWVQTPSQLWETKVGDCKSFTVFISAVAHYMGLDRIIRYVSYGTKNYTHVYPIIILPSGRRVVMDVVYTVQQGARPFAEKRYSKKTDYRVKAQPGLYKLGNTAMQELTTSVAELEKVAEQLPDSVVHAGPGDITNMTAGELDLYLLKDSLRANAMHAQSPEKRQVFTDAQRAIDRKTVAGIGSLQNDYGRSLESFIRKAQNNNAPAFQPFALEVVVNDAIEGMSRAEKAWQKRRRKLEKEIRQATRKRNSSRVARLKAALEEHYANNPQYSKKRNIFEKVGDTVRKAWKKWVNWVFKSVGKLMAPYYLFLFIKKRVQNKEINRRKAAQQKTFNFIADIGKLDKNKLSMVIATGIKEQTGKTPAQIIAAGGGAKVGAAPALAALVPKILKALGFVVEVVKKIAGIFKKNKGEAGQINKDSMSDPTLLADLNPQEATTDGKFDDGSSGGSGGIVALAVVAAGAAFAA